MVRTLPCFQFRCWSAGLELRFFRNRRSNFSTALLPLLLFDLIVVLVFVQESEAIAAAEDHGTGGSQQQLLDSAQEEAAGPSEAQDGGHDSGLGRAEASEGGHSGDGDAQLTTDSGEQVRMLVGLSAAVVCAQRGCSRLFVFCSLDNAN